MERLGDRGHHGSELAIPLYEFVCKRCDVLIESLRRTDILCPECGDKPKRRFSFNTQPVMQEHWNWSVGAPVSDMGKYKALLAKRSDEQSERLGMTVNYQPVDITDRAALGVTDDGMEETYAARRAEGLDEPKRKFLV